LARKYDANAQGRIQQLQDLALLHKDPSLTEVERLTGVTGRQIRYDLKRHPEAGLTVLRGRLCWTNSPAPVQPMRSRRPGLAEERWIDLLDILRHGPVSRDRLADLWRADLTEVETDLAPLVHEGLIRCTRRGGTVTYRLGSGFITEAPWPAADVNDMLDLLAQVWPLYADRPPELTSALAKLQDWQRAMKAPPPARRPACRVIKGPRLQANVRVEVQVARLEEAIQTRCRVRLRYTKGAGERVVEPLGLVYYWATDAWYLMVNGERPEWHPTPLRVDLISHTRILAERFVYPAAFNMAEHFRLSWGIEVGPVTPVRIRFYDEAGVNARLERETAHRLAPLGPAVICRAPGAPYVVYTDTIAGQYEVRHWLRTFGSSAVVEEPAQWRREMADNARRLLEVYEREQV